MQKKTPIKFNHIEFPNEEIKYIRPSWDDLNQLTFLISKEIIRSGMHFDRILTLAKGGWPMTRSLVDFLAIKNIASIGVKFYSGINTRLKEPKIYQDIPTSIENEKILLFDDVADTGGSLKFVTEHLNNNGAQNVSTATLFYKPWSKIKPDIFAVETDTWIIFPYELGETIKLLKDRWQKQNLEPEEINRRLQTLIPKKKYLEHFNKL
ncbi:MAG: phosphoribosyltransferase family protein [Candidatus Woesebacteria bacterium]|jgi:hypoxanthine phosphoribosyltransferase